MIRSEKRKKSFIKKIQGVKDIINFDDFNSSSSEELHIIEMKKMPMRMRTQVLLGNHRKQFLSTLVGDNNNVENKIEEASESESVYTFSSWSVSSGKNSPFKSVEKVPKMEGRVIKRAKSFTPRNHESSKDNDENDDNFLKEKFNKNVSVSSFIHDSSKKSGVDTKDIKTPNSRFAYKVTSRILSFKKQNRNMINDSSLKSSSEIDEDECEDSSKKNSKSMSEFDINKSVHTSKDHTSQVNQTSSISSVALSELRPNNISSPEENKTHEMNIKTSASTKDKRPRMSNIQSILNFNSNNIESGQVSPDGRVRRNSILSSVISYSSKATDKNNNEPNSPDEIKESKVSKKFSEQTTKRVVFLVLIVVMSEYIFLHTTYFQRINSYAYAADIVHDMKQNSNIALLIDFIEEYHKDSTPYRILEIKYTENDASKSISFDDYTDYREQEVEITSAHGVDVYVLIRNDLQFEAYLSLAKTTFILFIIMISALLISKDATALVLQPLETIMLKVNEMAEDPFQILKFSEIEAAVDK
jgi:hypothetical protein